MSVDKISRHITPSGVYQHALNKIISAPTVNASGKAEILNVSKNEKTGCFPKYINDEFIKIAKTDEFKSLFTSRFSEEILVKALQFAEYADTLAPLYKLCSVIAAARAVMDVKVSRYLANNSAIEKYFAEDPQSVADVQALQSNKMARLMKLFRTAKVFISKNSAIQAGDVRIDFLEESCNVERMVDDEGAHIGFTFESDNGWLKFKLQCKNNEEFVIRLSGTDFINNMPKKIPIIVDYTHLSVDRRVIFTNELLPVSSEKNGQIKIKAYAGIVHNILIKWQPHGYSDNEFIEMVNNLILDKAIYN